MSNQTIEMEAVLRPQPAFEIAGRAVGEGHPTLVVAEIAQAHDGSLGAAHAYIDAVGQAGADAVKFQTHLAAAESTPGEPFRVKFSRQDASRYAYWERMEFSEAQWQGLADHATQRELLFLSSPFSFAAVDLLERVGVPAWKVGAGETTNTPMLERMAHTKKPVLLSSGMSTWAELDEAVRVVREAGAPVGVYQCTTAYPCPPEQLGLNVIGELRGRYAVPVGLSDHSGTTHAAVAATALGASMIEVHVTFSAACFGPDVPASVTVEQLGDLVAGVRFVDRARRHPVDKEEMAEQLGELRQLFGKGVVAARDLPQGHVLEEDDMALKKPATGIAAARFHDVVGRTLARAVAADEPLREADLDG